MHEIMNALATPSGQIVVSAVVSSAVREGIVAMQTAKHKENGEISAGGTVSTRAAVEVLLEGLLSERGRALVVDVVGTVVKSVIPAILTKTESGNDNGNESVVNGIITRLESPVRRKRVGSFGAVGDESPVSRQLVLSMMQAQGGCGVVERLALLAIRDKELVRELVRTVVGEAVKTYLTTQNEMRKGEGMDNKVEAGQGASLWRVLVMSAVVDLKRALLRMGREGSTGWVVF